MILYLSPAKIIDLVVSCLSFFFEQQRAIRVITPHGSLGVDQLPVAMRGPEGLLCFLTSYLYACKYLKKLICLVLLDIYM